MASRYLIDILLQISKKGTGGKELTTELKGVDTATKKLGDSWKSFVAIGASVTAAAYAAKKAFDFGKEGAIITQTRDSFDGLLEKLNAAPDTLDKLRTAARGTVDDMTLMSSTSTLLAGTQGQLATELAGSTPELLAIAKAANKLNPTLGDTTFLYQSLATGIKRSSPLILDNLGLTIKIGEANEAYAAEMGKTVEQLSAQEKQIALLNATLDAGEVMLEQAGGTTESATDSFTQLTASVKNLTDRLKEEAAPAIGAVVDVLNRAIFVALDSEDAFNRLSDELAESTANYADYVEQMTNAAVEQGVLTEAQAAAVRETALYGEVSANTARELGSAITMTQHYADSIGLLTEQQIYAQRITGGVQDATEEWVEREREAVSITRDLTAEMQAYQDNMRPSVKMTRDAADVVEALTQREEEAEQAAEDLARAQEALAESTEYARRAFEGFYSVLGAGIGDLRSLDDAAQQSAKDYADALADLDREAGSSYANIRNKYEDSLPDPTDVKARMGMVGDAWDEWGLRLQDIMQNGVASPWAEVLQQMGYEKPPDVGIKEWAAGLRDAFYAGDIQGLINEDAEAWRAHTATVQAAQASETAAVQSGIAERRAALEAARQEQLAAEKEARAQATKELALNIAEQTGMLREWAGQTFGEDMAAGFDEANEVITALGQGFISLDSNLASMLSGIIDGIQTTKDETAALAEENKAAWEDVLSGDFAARMAEQQEAMKQALDVTELLPAEDMAAATAAAMEGVSTAIETGLPEQTFQPLIDNFVGAQESIISGAALMAEETGASFGLMRDDAVGFAADIVNAYTGNSVFPDIIAGGADMQASVTSNFRGMGSAASSITSAMVDDFRDVESSGVRAATKIGNAFVKKMGEAKRKVDTLIRSLKAIPQEITITIKTTVTGGDGLQHGGQWTVKGPGGIDNVPVSFMATAGEVVTVTPVGKPAPSTPGYQHGGQFTVPGRMAAQTVTIEGDTHNWNIQDQTSLALAMRLVENRQRERLNEFMGV